jgi:hypothetical protein
MSEPYWNPMVPELTVTDMARSLPFYQAAGFSVRFRRSAPDFVYLELGQAQLMLEAWHPQGWHTGKLQTPFGRGINLQIEVGDVTALAARLQAAAYPCFRPLQESWYAVADDEEEGQLEGLWQDPDGYLLRFVEILGSRPRPPEAP